MGGRGASSGMSVDKYGNPQNAYGTQYKTLFVSGNIAFVTKNQRDSETIIETQTKGRVYAVVGGKDLLSIIYFDNSNKKVKAIDLSHPHKGMNVHVHHGYFHSENDGIKGATKPNDKEKAMVDLVKKLWYNYLNAQTIV